jgi:hypothetical protein
MIERITRASPRLRARVAGVLYLVIFIAAPSGAGSATLGKMAITLACDTGVALLFYDLFKPVSRNLSLLGAAFRLIFVAVMTVNSLNYFGFLGFFNSTRSPTAFDAGYDIALVPFGAHCLVTGSWRAWATSPSSGLRSVTEYSYLIFWFPRSSEKGRSRFGSCSSV